MVGLSSYDNKIGNSRHQTFATEKLLNVEKNTQKVTLFEQLKLIVYSKSEMNDSWWQSVISGFFGRTMAQQLAFQSFIIYALLGTIQYELSTTLKLSQRPSSTPIQLQVYIILELLHSHFIKLHPRLDSKRNRRRRRLETKLMATRGNNYQTLPIVYSHRASNDIRATDLLLNTIIMLPHIVYKLYVPFYLFTLRKRKLWRHGQLEQIARISGKSYDRRSSTANQRNSSGRFRGHPT